MHQMSSQPMKHTTHKRTQWSQIIKENGQYQWKYTYQLQQSDVAHHTKHTPLNKAHHTKHTPLNKAHHTKHTPQSTSHQTHTTKHHQCTLTLNPPSLQNKTTDVVIQQQSRKLWWWILLVSERCWAHKKWNKIASDIKFVFYSSTITMVHGPINIRFFEGS